MNGPLLSIHDLHIGYRYSAGISNVVNGVDISVGQGEKVGLVGESGCGKTQAVRAILRLLPEETVVIPKGEIIFQGRDILKMNKGELKDVRIKGISMIYQEPSAVLNPVFTIGEQLMDILRYSLPQYSGKHRKQELRKRALAAIADVNIPDPDRIMGCYPHQLSGGMKQRICIAMAIAIPRQLLIADEPGTALDVTIQAQVNRLIDDLVTSKGLALILITHSLGVARELTDRIYVMYAGEVVETAKTDELFDRPLHPYTRGLLACIPRLSGKGMAEGIEGHVPDYKDMPEGCRFCSRCTIASEECGKSSPHLRDIGNEHRIACFNADDIITVP
jgi:peptide/nickel transport system ATP-binding protein